MIQVVLFYIMMPHRKLFSLNILMICSTCYYELYHHSHLPTLVLHSYIYIYLYYIFASRYRGFYAPLTPELEAAWSQWLWQYLTRLRGEGGDPDEVAENMRGAMLGSWSTMGYHGIPWDTGRNPKANHKTS